MMTYRVTPAELRAYALLQGPYGDGAELPDAIWRAANEILALAEQIKAERAIAAMQR